MILSTASPYKFAPDVLTALRGKDAVEGLDVLCLRGSFRDATGVQIPKQIEALKTMPVRHQTVCEIDGMQEAMLKELQ